jgi:hypothetical protein
MKVSCGSGQRRLWARDDNLGTVLFMIRYLKQRRTCFILMCYSSYPSHGFPGSPWQVGLAWKLELILINNDS